MAMLFIACTSEGSERAAFLAVTPRSLEKDEAALKTACTAQRYSAECITERSSTIQESDPRLAWGGDPARGTLAWPALSFAVVMLK